MVKAAQTEGDLLRELRAAVGRDRDRPWRALVARYERLVFSVARRVRVGGFGLSEEDARDVAGDVWLKLLAGDARAIREFDESRGCSVASFVGIVARSAAIDFLRRKSKRDERMLDEEWGVAVNQGIELERARELLAEVKGARLDAAATAIESLPAEEREFAVAAFVHERTMRELAREFGIPQGSVMSKKFRLRRKLAALVLKLEREV